MRTCKSGVSVLFGQHMTEETVSATTTISTSAETVFAVLADPSRQAAIDGTDWGS
jgi:hypothetical protein